MIEMEDEGCDSKVKTALEQLQHGKFQLCKVFFLEKMWEHVSVLFLKWQFGL